jgi:hypothetical protein
MNCEEIKRRNKYLMVAVVVLLIIILVLLFSGGRGSRSRSKSISYNHLFSNNAPNRSGWQAHN